MILQYLSVTKIGHPTLIFASLVLTVLDPTIGAIISGAFLIYTFLNCKLNRSTSVFLSTIVVICAVSMLNAEDLSSLISAMDTKYNDEIAATLVVAICMSSVIYFYSKPYKATIITILLLFSAFNILQTANSIQTEKSNIEKSITTKIETTLNKLNKAQLDQCITSQHVNEIPWFIFQKRYGLKTDDSNIQGVFDTLENRQVGIFSWSQMADTRSSLLKNTDFTDTNHDVLMTRIGVLNDQNSIIVLAAPIQNQKQVDSITYISMFGFSLTLLLIGVAIILINEVKESRALYLVAMASLMALGMHGIESLVSAAILIMTIFFVIMYRKVMPK